MKGQARSTYTPTKHRWLRTLAAVPGSARTGKGSPAFACMALGWTAWASPHRPGGGEVLTATGRAVLAEWDRAYGEPQGGHDWSGPPPVSDTAAAIAWLLTAGQAREFAYQLLDALPPLAAGGAVGPGFAVPPLGCTHAADLVRAMLDGHLTRAPLCHLDDGEPVRPLRALL